MISKLSENDPPTPSPCVIGACVVVKEQFLLHNDKKKAIANLTEDEVKNYMKKAYATLIILLTIISLAGCGYSSS